MSRTAIAIVNAVLVLMSVGAFLIGLGNWISAWEATGVGDRIALRKLYAFARGIEEAASRNDGSLPDDPAKVWEFIADGSGLRIWLPLACLPLPRFGGHLVWVSV